MKKATMLVFILPFLLLSNKTLAQGQGVVMAGDDYAPVVDENEWLDSRDPEEGCDMPKAHQVSIPLCPGCVLIDVRPHLDDPSLILLDFGTDQSFVNVVNFYRANSGYSVYSRENDERRVRFVPPEEANLGHIDYLVKLLYMPNILVKDTRTTSDHERHIVMTVKKAADYDCVFDDEN